MKKRNLKRIFLLTTLAMLLVGTVSFATDANGDGLDDITGNPIILENGLTLLTDITGWLLIIIPVVGIVVVAWLSINKMSSDDEAKLASLNKWIKRVIIWGAIGESATGLVTLLFNYFN